MSPLYIVIRTPFIRTLHYIASPLRIKMPIARKIVGNTVEREPWVMALHGPWRPRAIVWQCHLQVLFRCREHMSNQALHLQDLHQPMQPCITIDWHSNHQAQAGGSGTGPLMRLSACSIVLYIKGRYLQTIIFEYKAKSIRWESQMVDILHES